MAEVVHPFGIGQLAPEFHGLLGVDGQRYSLSSFNEMTVLVIAFTGNGCPTVKAEEDKMKALQGSYGLSISTRTIVHCSPKSRTFASVRATSSITMPRILMGDTCESCGSAPASLPAPNIAARPGALFVRGLHDVKQSV
jgi:Redoxin